MKNVRIAVAGTGYVGLSIATLLSQHTYNSLKNNSYIILHTPLPNILGIQSHNFFKVRDIAPATHLPQPGQSLICTS